MSRTPSLSEHISTMDLRARLGDLLDRVRLRLDTFVIERKGKAIAAIVPIERMERLEAFARGRADELERFQSVHAKGLDQGEVEDRLKSSLLAARAKRASRL